MRILGFWRAGERKEGGERRRASPPGENRVERQRSDPVVVKGSERVE